MTINTQSLWSAETPDTGLKSSDTLPQQVDVVVVGAGIAGMTTAALLARAGQRVCVVEMQDTIGAGDTSKTTAHITQFFDSGYATILKDFGQEQAEIAAQGFGAGVETIASLIEDCKIECDFSRLPVYLYPHTAKSQGEVDEEADAMEKVGIHAAREKLELSFAQGNALRLDHQAQFQPLAYLSGLMREIHAKGGNVCTGVRFASVEERADGVLVHTDVHDIQANHVVLATHTPPNKFTLQLKLSPQRSYVLAVRCKTPFPKGLFYDTHEPYHYLRSHQDPKGELVIVGGADHRAGDVTETQEAYAGLERYARQHLDVEEVAYRWSGMVFEPTDALPFIGLNPGTHRTWVISGLAGDGMVAGTLGAMICSDGILGAPSRFAAPFAPGRIKPVAQAVEFAKHNAQVTKHLVADRVKALLEKEPVGPHQGKILRHEGQMAAVYHDGKTLHCVSPVCPHAGCYVQFNNAEQTWDCPCHGSRFSGAGKLLSGPAVSDLPPL